MPAKKATAKKKAAKKTVKKPAKKVVTKKAVKKPAKKVATKKAKKSKETVQNLVVSPVVDSSGVVTMNPVPDDIAN
jgi:RNA polymerase primary sigma factor